MISEQEQPLAQVKKAGRTSWPCKADSYQRMVSGWPQTLTLHSMSSRNTWNDATPGHPRLPIVLPRRSVVECGRKAPDRGRRQPETGERGQLLGNRDQGWVGQAKARRTQRDLPSFERPSVERRGSFGRPCHNMFPWCVMDSRPHWSPPPGRSLRHE